MQRKSGRIFLRVIYGDHSTESCDKYKCCALQASQTNNSGENVMFRIKVRLRVKVRVKVRVIGFRTGVRINVSITYHCRESFKLS